MSATYCPSCGQSDVTVGLDSVLIETRPVVRRHACGVGGPGSAAQGDPFRDHPMYCKCYFHR